MSKLGYLDSIRGLACICVVLSHASLVFFPYIHAFFGEVPEANGTQALIHNSPLTFLCLGHRGRICFFCFERICVEQKHAQQRSIRPRLSCRCKISAINDSCLIFMPYSIYYLQFRFTHSHPAALIPLVLQPNCYDPKLSGVLALGFN